MITNQIPIGTKYKTRGKAPRVCTVVDMLITTNLAGDVVKVKYVSEHEFCGQIVKDSDVVATTIKMGEIK